MVDGIIIIFRFWKFSLEDINLFLEGRGHLDALNNWFYQMSRAFEAFQSIKVTGGF